jgi:hypothetical protein
MSAGGGSTIGPVAYTLSPGIRLKRRSNNARSIGFKILSSQLSSGEILGSSPFSLPFLPWETGINVDAFASYI